MRIGFTGSRHGMTDVQLAAVREIIENLTDVQEAHHGDCVGADAEFHAICHAFGIPIHLHPPTDPKHRAHCENARVTAEPKAYLKRNRRIVDAADLMFGAPSGPEKVRSGTWSTIRYSRKTNTAIVVVMPNGETESDE